jgi:hypothetical protein
MTDEVTKARSLHIVMAGLVPAIHAAPHMAKVVDARAKPGHDEFEVIAIVLNYRLRLSDTA